jgi:hypothetical protein
MTLKQVAPAASSSTTTAGGGERDGINLFPHVSNLCLACCKVCSCSDTGGVVWHGSIKLQLAPGML